MRSNKSIPQGLRKKDQDLALKLSKKQKRQLFEDHLSFYLKYAHEAYAKTEQAIQAKLTSEEERLKYWDRIILKKRMEVMEHPLSQRRHADEMIRIWKNALNDYRRLKDGTGSPEEVQAFNLHFASSTPTYYTAEETPQQKLFSLD